MGTAAVARDGVKRFPESDASASTNASRIRLDRGCFEAVAAIRDPNFDEFTRDPPAPGSLAPASYCAPRPPGPLEPWTAGALPSTPP